MKVLIIGATGQIGYAVTSALSNTDHRTSVLVRNAHKLAFPGNVSVLESATFTADAFVHALRDAECVIYGIGLPEQFSFDDQVFQRVNYGLFKTFLDAFQQSAVRRLVYISTYEVFQPIAGVIRETHPIAEQIGVSPYYKAMIQAYRLALESAETMDLALTTIHPAAVYGGLNTGDGFTNYIENLLHSRFGEVPVIINGRFPIVHADSLATAIVHALGKPGAYIVSDQMTSLQEIARTLSARAKSYSPPTIPLRMAYASTWLLEIFARLSRTRPIMARAQLDFITQGYEPRADRARAELGWQPLDLPKGIEKYLHDRTALLA